MNDLALILDDISKYVRRYVVVTPTQVHAVALWIVHTYVFDCAPATPYLHPYSPEPGSGKTTLLDVLNVTTRAPFPVENISEAALFRLIEQQTPTLLFDEVDAVFGKAKTEASEGIRQVLNSGYRKGKRAVRCAGRNRDELATFELYCPKATAGLNELPGTLATRAIPIAMKPPRPDDVYEDFDFEEASPEGEQIGMGCAAWADTARDTLTDPNRKPAKLAELDPRANEIWRILFRIADMAGEDWPERARTAAIELSGRERRVTDASNGVRLLEHIRTVFVDHDHDRIACGPLVEKLNDDDDMPYGGWSDGKGITTRQLGKKLALYEIIAKPIRIDGARAGNGYEYRQFEDAWSRYLPPLAHPNQYTGTSRIVEPKVGESEPVRGPRVPVAENGANPHQQTLVPVVPVLKANGQAMPTVGQPGYPLRIESAYQNGHLTERELEHQQQMHRLARGPIRTATPA